jgi:hypothetical protein
MWAPAALPWLRLVLGNSLCFPLTNPSYSPPSPHASLNRPRNPRIFLPHAQTRQTSSLAHPPRTAATPSTPVGAARKSALGLRNALLCGRHSRGGRVLCAEARLRPHHGCGGEGPSWAWRIARSDLPPLSPMWLSEISPGILHYLVPPGMFATHILH